MKWSKIKWIKYTKDQKKDLKKIIDILDSINNKPNKLKNFISLLESHYNYECYYWRCIYKLNNEYKDVKQIISNNMHQEVIKLLKRIYL